MSAVTEWQKVVAKMSPEQLRLYDAAELEWQAELDAYIKDYERAIIDYQRNRLPVPPPTARTANCIVQAAKNRLAGRKRGTAIAL